MAAPANSPGQAGPDQKSQGEQGIPDNAADQAGGVVKKAEGLAVAVTKAPQKVVDNVLKPLQNGVTGLGNVFDLGDLLGGNQDENISSGNGDAGTPV